MRVVVTFDSGPRRHQVGGGGFDSVVGAAAAAEKSLPGQETWSQATMLKRMQSEKSSPSSA